MLKRFASHLIASGLAAVVGAVVGGWITHDIITKDTRTQFVVGSYSSYLNEATRAFFRAKNGDSIDGLNGISGAELTNEDKLRIKNATALLVMSASEDVLCWAFSFESEITSVRPDGEDEYNNLLFSIREEVLGETIEGSGSHQECTWSVM